jgi:thiol-disulfide isomerase/thioredoxin
MKNFIAIIILLSVTGCNTLYNNYTFSNTPQANTFTDSAKHLLGHCSVQLLQQSPFNTWFTTNYNSYLPNDSVINKMKQFSTNIQVEIFLGTWCGDSKREVPRIYKVLQLAGIDTNNIKLIMVNNASTAYKQSPQHEEANKYIFRVPTCIVYKNKKAIGTFIESPVKTIEDDLLQILQQKKYTPNYAAAYKTIQWLQMPIHKQEKQRVKLISELNKMQKKVNEINSLAYLLMTQQNYNLAIKVLHINEAIFPNNSNITEFLLNSYIGVNNKEETINYANKLLLLQPNNIQAKELLQKQNK